MSLAGLLLTLIAAACVYLASPNRHWPSAGPRRRYAFAAAATGAAGLGLWIDALGPIAGAMAALATAMFAWVALPCLGAWRCG